MPHAPAPESHPPCPACAATATELAERVALRLVAEERGRASRVRAVAASAFLAGLLVASLARTAVLHAEEAPRGTPTPAPSFWDRAVSSVSDTADLYTNDEAIADYVVASVAKQARVNKILARRQSSYRIADLKVVVSVPPALEVGISEIPTPAP